MTTIIAIGNTEALSTGPTAANVSFSPSVGNTFRVSNIGTTNEVFVGVYNSAAVAANIAVPTAGSPYPGLVHIGPAQSQIIGGNFGSQNTSTIYVAAIGIGLGDIYITPMG